MPQQTWTYQNNEGMTYEVSIYHGQNSGHVLIFSESEIITIDFAVLKSKVYSFYLGEEWFELKIEIEDGSTEYRLFNVSKSKEIKLLGEPNFPTKHIFKAIAIVVVIGLMVCLFSWFLKG
jgi:hypothetical protein